MAPNPRGRAHDGAVARLALPHPRFHASFLGFVAELVAEGRAGDRSMIGQDIAEWSGAWELPEGFASYVAQVRARADVADPGFVTHTTWWWVEAAEVLGRIDLRHDLTEHLREVGGHVGYDVRPSARRRGHATAMLAAVLPQAARRGIEAVLVTCDHDNVASRRTIERNGGVLEDRHGAKLRYWVATSA